MAEVSAIIPKIRSRILACSWIPYVLTSGAGAVSALALPSFHILPVLWLAFPVLLWLIVRSEKASSAFMLGWSFGFAHFVVSLYWVANALLVDGSDYAWAVPFAVAALPAVLAVFIGLATLLTFALVRKGWRPIPSLAIAWTAGEFLRGHLFTGLPWNLIGTVWAFSDAMVQPAWLIGTYGLGFLTVLIAASPYALVKTGWRRPQAWLPLAASLGLVVLMAGFGGIRLYGHETAFHRDITLRLVQANVPQSEKWVRNLIDDHFLTHLRLSDMSGKDRITAFIWPETAVQYFLESEPSRRALIARFLPEDAVLITGAPRIERRDGALRHLWNSLFVVDATGGIPASYDKVHLVPFGEYLPLRSVLGRFGLDKIVYGLTDFSPGTDKSLIAIPELPAFKPLICYEIIFPGAVTGEGDRPHWLLNITNDAWYGDTIGPRQHLTAAKLRAVEEGLPVVRAAGTGISAIFDAYGRHVAGLGYNVRGIVDSWLPVAGDSGFFARFGNWILIPFFIAAGVCAVFPLRRLR